MTGSVITTASNARLCCADTPSSVSYILSGQQNASLSIKWENKHPKKNLVKRLQTQRKMLPAKFAYAAAAERRTGCGCGTFVVVPVVVAIIVVVVAAAVYAGSVVEIQ